MRPSALAIIPARGGSKGIPGKNSKILGGLPLIARAISAAKGSSRVERVVVSTDDDLIASIARDYGAEIVVRPEELAGDTSSSESALLHTLNVLSEGVKLPNQLLFLQCTSPFTSSQQIDTVLSALDDPFINSSFSVSPWHGFIWQGDGLPVNHDPNKPRQRRQDLMPSYIETGAIYAMNTEAFLLSESRFCKPWMPVIMNEHSPEIDTLEDFEYCHFLMSKSGLK
ncbi:N-acylneuraminate cytidylyltransferase [Synechococcus sp. PROS-9-1]|uniref:acylneuraminate cytidylyltransferase family protein n=1 Tax=Synechococcus sp. PROS-9-1 TaxID=1968775 RepID=UPI001648B557|nr:acylneuraminate cytidylyltransferase family protein [Synechococcus sp. PROS-9-1]QNJ30631.1 N-acylneuraminate cytidylyltransferase [Synechococcus sp. PROS-9-1]